MEYISLHIRGIDEVQQALLMDRLAEEGFESFEERDTELLGYIQAPDYNPESIGKILADSNVSAEIEKILEKNWNEEWEKNFKPVDIIGKCYIRAPFHQPVEGYAYEIIIEPKMSFGTAHHETTAMMLELMLALDFNGTTVLDMGCGTGILAILAHKMKAAKVVAADNDEWAFNNSLENVQRNEAGEIQVLHGGLEFVPALEFDIILANINRNILLDQISWYSGHLRKGGLLLMSGFYEQDIPVIEQKTKEKGMETDSFISSNHWVAAKFRQ